MAFWEPYRSHLLYKNHVAKENAYYDALLEDQCSEPEEDRMTQNLREELAMSQYAGLRQGVLSPRAASSAPSRRSRTSERSRASGSAAPSQASGSAWSRAPSRLSEAEEGRPCLNIPRRGDTVQLTGLSHHPELNHAKAEIASNGADRNGYLTVRLGGGAQDGPPPRMLKVRPNRLLPLKSQSLVDLANPAKKAALDTKSRWCMGVRMGSGSGLFLGDTACGPADWASAVSCSSTRASERSSTASGATGRRRPAEVGGHEPVPEYATRRWLPINQDKLPTRTIL